LNDTLHEKVGENDRVVIFFAGHGGTYTSDGRANGYIVPVDGDASYASNIQMDELRTSALRLDKAKHILFIMDACYGGLLAATRGSKVENNHPHYLEEITKRKARQVLTAGGADQQVADGGPGGHSHFTYHLLRALKDAQGDLNGDSYITFAELVAYLLPVADTFQQTPTYSTLAGHALGEFTFTTGTPLLVAQAPAVAPPSREPGEAFGSRGRDPQTAEILDFVGAFFDSNNREDVEAFVAMFGGGAERYFGWGSTTADAIRQDKAAFFKRWPDVEYTPVGEPKVTKLDNGRFRVNV
jgi:hypothetical protein